MTTTLVWTGVALWLSLNAAIAARRIYVSRPLRVAAHSARTIYLDRRQG
jgi:hypothetical protein